MVPVYSPFDHFQAFSAIRIDAHLVQESHIVVDHLARHPDVVGDLINIEAFHPAHQDAGTAQTMDGRPLYIIRVDFPCLFLDLFNLFFDNFRHRAHSAWPPEVFSQ
jgi:hypothetical protein